MSNFSSIAGIVSAKRETPDSQFNFAQLDKLKLPPLGEPSIQPFSSGAFLRWQTSPSPSLFAVKDQGAEFLITADSRLENHNSLAQSLGLEPKLQTPESELILRAYLKWGQKCPAHLHGDFSFSIWDPLRQILFAARDRFGVKPYVYYHGTGTFIFASEANTILAFESVPKSINRKRIADFLVPWLEGINHSCTFFQNIHRLPPAHSLTLHPDSNETHIDCYWQLESPVELKLASDKDYEELCLDHLSRAVSCSFPDGETVGSMLSGGLDSSSIIALASQITQNKCSEKLATYSAVSPSNVSCHESASARAVAARCQSNPSWITAEEFFSSTPNFHQVAADCDNPFNFSLQMAKAVFKQAQEDGINAICSGIGGDNISGVSNRYLVYLFREHAYKDLFREVKGYARPPRNWRFAARLAGACALPGLLPDFAWQPIRRHLKKEKIRQRIESSYIHPRFAREIDLKDRLAEIYDLELPQKEPNGVVGRQVQIMNWPCYSAALERYDSVARANGLALIHPYLNLDLVEFFLSLPWQQKKREAWSKHIVRRTMTPYLPEITCWRKDGETLAHPFIKACIDKELTHPSPKDSGLVLDALSEFVRPEIIDSTARQLKNGRRSPGCFAPDLMNLLFLGHWLLQHDSH